MADDLKNIRVKKDFEDYRLLDAERIVKVMADHGYRCSTDQAIQLWERASDCMAAGWLCLPDTDYDLFLELQCHFVEES